MVPGTETCEQCLYKQMKDRRLRVCYDCVLLTAVTALVNSYNVYMLNYSHDYRELSGLSSPLLTQLTNTRFKHALPK
jgi:hypothetical protein